MSNPIKKEYDKLSTTKDIIERENIVHLFETTGFLDRNDAINKITSLQFTDTELVKATAVQQVKNGRVDLYQVDNYTIITNIKFQIDFLKAKLVKIEKEEKEGRSNDRLQ